MHFYNFKRALINCLPEKWSSEENKQKAELLSFFPSTLILNKDRTVMITGLCHLNCCHYSLCEEIIFLFNSGLDICAHINKGIYGYHISYPFVV